MTFFDDFATALDNYVDDHVTLTTVLNIATDNIAPATPNAINVSEKWRFKVTVANSNHLDMINVRLRITGLNGTTVSEAVGGPFAASFDATTLLAVNGFGAQTTGFFFFTAPAAAKAAGTDLVKVHIQAYDGSLTHLLNGHTGSEAGTTGIYENQVFP
jgi:hypothetical protein